jgi:hypothetical protein
MKRGTVVTLSVAMLAILGGCGNKDGDQFIGKWENAKRKETVEITRNGDAFVITDTAPNFFGGGMKTVKIPATYQKGMLQVGTAFGNANIGYDKQHDTLMMPTMDGSAELTRVK